MLNQRTFLLGVGGGLLISATAATGAGVSYGTPDQGHYSVAINGTTANVAAYERDGRIKRLYGQAFSSGDSPVQSAEAFLQGNSGLFGVAQADLVPVGPFDDGHHIQPLMYDQEAGQYKFTGVYYAQTKDGIPVFRSRLTLLVRNEADYPLVLAANDLRNLGGFDVQAGPRALNAGRGIAQATKAWANLDNFTMPEMVIWAGVDDMLVQPALAYTFVGDNGNPADGSPPERRLFVTDASTGAILYDENQIIFEDVVGSVSGRATEGVGAEHCEDEPTTPLPYAQVNIGSTKAYADENGDFVIPWGGTTPVTVESGLRGDWFVVTNQAGANSIISMSVTPPGPADFVHNEPNTSEYYRAEVNGYLQANIVRDYVLKYNPTYPSIYNDHGFPVKVNDNTGYCPCNAWYDYSSITFCRIGSGCPNTAWSTVIHHEYGHHLVSVAGSGQGEYGEGMGDVMGLLITDNSGTGWGFFGDCSTPLRDADNTMQYPCSGEIHYCGMLISGCVWSTRTELKAVYPDDYRDIISNLAINSMLMHSGSDIDPSITIDFLVLDDDNGDIYDGTPHYWEIAAGFGDHNMDAPTLSLLSFDFPEGLPGIIDPDGGTTVRLVVAGIAGEPKPGAASLYFDDGTGWDVYSMTQVEPNVYDAVLPGADCGTQVEYYFEAETTTGMFQYYPKEAPDDTVRAVAAYGGEVVFSDSFESDRGWAESGDATDGPWERGIPVDCNRGDPPTDADGTGRCALTDNSSADGCNSDVDGGTTMWTSPILDASGDGAIISYYRWYSNTYGADPENDTFYVRVSDDGGSTWTQLEKVGPSGPEVDGGWYYKEFSVADFVDQTDQFRIRFEAGDMSSGSVVEAAVDGIELKWFDCTEPDDPEDINGDGVVDVLDLLAVLGAWGPCDSCPEDVNDDGVVDVLDLLAILAAWS